MITDDFKKVFCPYCKNKESNDCEIRVGIDNKPRCPYYELDKDKLKEDHNEGITWNFVRKEVKKK